MVNNKLIDYPCPFCKETGISKEVLYQYKVYTETLGKTTVTIVICLSCHFVFNSPRLSSKEIDKHYLQNSSGAIFRQDVKGSRIFTLDLERTKFIEKICGNLDKGNFLDVGCGQGSLLKKLKLPHLKKYGMDPIKNSSDNFKDKIFYIQEFIENYKEGLETFDVISCISSLEHYYNPKIVFDKFKNLLMSDGILFIEVPDTLNPKAQLAEFFSFEHLSHFTKVSLTRILNLHGFDVIEFDKNLSIPNIRVAAKKIKKNIYKKVKENEFLQIKNTFNKYINSKKLEIERMDRLINLIIDDCKLNKKKILIYGAGDHTIHLFQHFKIEKYVSYYVDSDPKKWGKTFRGKKILKPSDINKINLVNILISSHAYENEIFDTISKNNINQLGVTCLYKN